MKLEVQFEFILLIIGH